MNYPDAVNRRNRIMADVRSRMAMPPWTTCTDCDTALPGRSQYRCEDCHKAAIAKNHERDNMPVGRQSSPEAEELRELLDVGPSVLRKTTGGGTRVVRSTRGM